MGGDRTFCGLKLHRRREPKETDLHVLLVLPFFLIGIDSIFTGFYYLAAGVPGTKEALREVESYGSGVDFKHLLFNFLFLYVPVLAWYWPIWRFIRTHDPALKAKVRDRLSTVYRAILLLFCMLLAAKIAAHVVAYWGVLEAGIFLRYNLPAIGLSVLLQFGFAGVFIENVLGNAAGPVVERLYDRAELFDLRKGLHLPLVAKIGGLLLCSAAVPMLMIYFYLRNSGVEGLEMWAVKNLIMNCLIIMMIGVSVLVGTTQRPIDGIIEKMKRLAAGDFDVKSRIYFADEIARIKASFNKMVDQLMERETLRETFGKYVSVEIAKKLLGSGGADLGGEEIEATVLFCDIRNFTPMSEKMTPREVVEFLNEYFAHVTGPIMEHRGVINKFMGDAVMAVYAPLLGSDDHAGDAVRSALGMRKALERFNASGRTPGEVRFGVGIQTGALVAGNVGTLARLEYTVIGDTVNVASRLESATKELGADILVSEAVRDKVEPAMKGKASFERMGDVALKGKSRPVTLFAVR